MEQVLIFPFSEYWWFYAGFTAFVLLILFLDLGVFHKSAHVVTIKESAAWSVVWFSLALIFNVLLYLFTPSLLENNARLMAIPGFDPQATANQMALEFLTGFIIEKTLAIDNIFVFVVVFSFFGIPAQFQHRVLFYGILGALVFRAIFIALGSVLMQYHAVVIIAGIFLIFTGFKIFVSVEKVPDPGKNIIINLVKRFVPISTQFDGQRFFTRINGKRHATPLFLGLLFIETSDIIFAIDSVPAIFAITKEPLIVFTSNIFAILGLRSLYFMLASIIHKFRFLKYGLGVILIFVGLKMAYLNGAMGGKFPISWSLGFIGATILVSIVLSLRFPKTEEDEISRGP